MRNTIKKIVLILMAVFTLPVFGQTIFVGRKIDNNIIKYPFGNVTGMTNPATATFDMANNAIVGISSATVTDGTITTSLNPNSLTFNRVGSFSYIDQTGGGGLMIRTKNGSDVSTERLRFNSGDNPSTLLSTPLEFTNGNQSGVAAIPTAKESFDLYLKAATGGGNYRGILGIGETDVATSGIATFENGILAATGLSLFTGNTSGVSERIRISSGGTITIPGLAGNGSGVVAVDNNGEISYSAVGGGITAEQAERNANIGLEKVVTISGASVTATNDNFDPSTTPDRGKTVLNNFTGDTDFTLPAAVNVYNRPAKFASTSYTSTATISAESGETITGTYVEPDTGIRTPIPANHNVIIDSLEIARITKRSANSWEVHTDGHVEAQFDTDALAYINAHGGMSATEQDAVNTFVEDLKGYGLWDKSVAGYPFVGDSGSELAIDAVTPGGSFDMTWNGTPTYGTNQVTGNGSDAYGDTNIVPDTHLTDGDVTIMVWVETDVTGGYSHWGAKSTTPSTRTFQAEYYLGNFNFDAYSNSGGSRTQVASPPSRIGSWFSTIRSNTDREVHFNGSSAAVQTTAGTLDGGNLTGSIGFMGTITDDTTPGNYSSETYYMMWVFSEGLSDTEISNFHAAAAALNTALSR